MAKCQLSHIGYMYITHFPVYDVACTTIQLYLHAYMCVRHTGATIKCPNEMPVSKGSSAVIWCETGLPDSQNVQITFHFYGRKGECPHAVHVQRALASHSNWMANRNDIEPYTCGLYIQNMQLSDSGDYYCEVIIPSTNITVKSSSLRIEVASPNPVKLPLEIVIPVASVSGLLILILSVILCTPTLLEKTSWVRQSTEFPLCKLKVNMVRATQYNRAPMQSPFNCI